MDEALQRYRALLLPRTELLGRLGRIRERLRQASMDGLLLLQSVDLYYFSGTLQDGILWIPTEGEPVLLVRRHPERARNESPLAEVRPLRDRKTLIQVTGPLQGMRIGLELDVLPAREYLQMREILPGVRFEDATPLLREVRQIKSPLEIEWLREAARREARVYARIPLWLREGLRELEFAAEIERALRLEEHQGLVRFRRWNQELFFGPVVSGPSACYPTCIDSPVGGLGLCPAMPHGCGTRRIRRNEPVLVDLVFGYCGYCVDKARTYSLGDLPAEGREAYQLCRRIQDEAVSLLKPGARCADIYEQVMGPLEGHRFRPHLMGTGRNQVRFLAHGVGLELDEWPVLSARSEACLAPGMVLALEPKIFLPGLGGIGLENCYLITEKEPEKLTDFPDDLVVLDA
ncbi:MAG: Xaa-Pro peptidase family protein [bacterium]